MINFEHPLVLLLIIAILSWLYLKRNFFLANLAALIRVFVLLLLILTLANPRIGSRVEMNYVYFLLDISASTALAGSKEEILDRLRELAPPRENTLYGLIAFGEKPRVLQGFSKELKSDLDLDLELKEGTDIAAAIRLAVETFPKKGNREIVLITDGQATKGNLDGALASAVGEGIKISVLPLEAKQKEILTADLELPSQVVAGIPFKIKVKVAGSGKGRVILYRDWQYIDSVEVALDGVEVVEFVDLLEETGNHYYQAYIKGEDVLEENNSLMGATFVQGKPRILILDQGQEGISRLLEGLAFHRSDIDSFIMASGITPLTLAAYDLVILDNIKIASLLQNQIEALKRYVEIGGGLFVVQGRRAVSELGRTEFEKLLPVFYEVPQALKIPGLAVIFILDKSSSMAERAGPGLGVRKIDLLKEAAAASIEILEPKDLAGVIAFDREYTWIVEIQQADDKAGIYEKLKLLEPGGGTDLYYPLKEAKAKMEEIEAGIKHIMIYSDGKVIKKGRDYEGLIEEIKKSYVTFSSIAIDENPDLDIMERIATAGRGKLYVVKDIKNLPQVSVKEIRRIARRRWIEGEIKLAGGPFYHLLPVATSEVPILEGYTLTFPKPTAKMLLVSENGDPIMGFWRYGLGKVGVLNTDLEGEGSASWLGWEKLPQLLGGILKWVYSPPLAGEMFIKADEKKITVEVLKEGRWADLLEVKGQLAAANGDADTKTETVVFTQVAPGRYEASIEDLPKGVYLLKVMAERDGEEVAIKTTTISIPYKDEYRRIGLYKELLERIIEISGGQYIEDEFILKGGEGVLRYRDLWPFSLLAGLILFIADLALRKLPFF